MISLGGPQGEASRFLPFTMETDKSWLAPRSVSGSQSTGFQVHGEDSSAWEPDPAEGAVALGRSGDGCSCGWRVIPPCSGLPGPPSPLPVVYTSDLHLHLVTASTILLIPSIHKRPRVLFYCLQASVQVGVKDHLFELWGWKPRHWSGWAMGGR